MLAPTPSLSPSATTRGGEETVRVVLRTRPLVPSERGEEASLSFPSACAVRTADGHSFHFDAALDPSKTHGDVFRLVGEPFAMSIGGETQNKPHDGPRYSAVYEIDDPKVLASPEWSKAVEAGRWPGQVRPFTHNRRHAVFKVL